MNQYKQYLLLSVIKSGKHHFTEIADSLSISRKTITAYLKRFLDLGILKKGITEKGRAGYFLTETGEKYFNSMDKLSGIFERIGELKAELKQLEVRIKNELR